MCNGAVQAKLWLIPHCSDEQDGILEKNVRQQQTTEDHRPCGSIQGNGA